MYERLSQFAQTFGLLMFVLAFIMVLFYALAPSRRKTFDHAANLPLDDRDLDDE